MSSLAISAPRAGSPAHRVVLAGIVLVGALLRLHNLGRDDFWTDEMATLQYAASVSSTYTDTHPPLYYLLIHAWLSVVPVSESMLRLPSALLGVGAVAAMYGFGATLFGRATGLVAAVILALSPMHVYYSQDARMYSLLTLTTILSCWALFAYLRDRSTRRALVYVLATVFLAYSHVFGMVVILAQNVAFLYAALLVGPPRLRDFLRWTAMQMAIVASIAPWLLYLTAHPGAERVSWIPPAQISDLYEIFKEFAFSGRVMLAALLVLAMLGCVCISRARVRLADSLDIPVLLLLLVVPLVAGFALSKTVLPVFISKYLISVTVPFYLLAAHGLATLKPELARYGIGAAVLALGLWSVQDHVTTPHKLPWQEVVRTVAPRVEPTDLLTFEGFGPDAFDYYAERQQTLGGVERLWLTPDGREVPGEAPAKLTAAMAGRSRFWLIQANSKDDDRRFNEYVRRTYVLTDDLTFPGVRARLFRVRR